VRRGVPAALTLAPLVEATPKFEQSSSNNSCRAADHDQRLVPSLLALIIIAIARLGMENRRMQCSGCWRWTRWVDEPEPVPGVTAHAKMECAPFVCSRGLERTTSIPHRMGGVVHCTVGR
jgi:hypothetical protein